MSYANGTEFYNLPQTVGADKRDWFDTNAAFAAVDAALHAAATGQAADAEAISTINSKLAADEADIAALQTASSTQAASISTLQTTVNGQATQIADVRQDAEDMITANNEGAAATSTKAYAIGDYFIYNDVLYKATAAIAIGDTIVPNTNCEATNVYTEITAVKSDLSEIIGSITSTNSDTYSTAFAKLYNIINSAENTLSEKQFSNIKLKFSDKVATLSNVRGEENNRSYVFIVHITTNPLTTVTLMSILIGASGASVSNTTYNSDGTFAISNAGSSNFHNIKIDVV